MPSGTKFNPLNISQFDKTLLNKCAQGVLGAAAPNTTTNFDLTLSDDMIIAGGHALLVQGATWGDYCEFQVILPVGLGGGVANEFIQSWYMDPSVIQQPLPPSNYPAKIPAGFTLRVVYHSVAPVTGANLAINYNLEKVLS
jgi:hypothetical protein